MLQRHVGDVYLFTYTFAVTVPLIRNTCDKLDTSAMPHSITSEMDVLNLIQSRHSVRDFDGAKPVDLEMLKRILQAAQSSPSSQNNQPCRTIVLTPPAAHKLSQCLLDAKAEEKMPDYINRPQVLTQKQQEGIDAYGKWWFEEMNGLAKDDAKGRAALHSKNLTFWGANIHLIVTTNRNAVAGTFLDAGMYIQNILLGCHACGLSALPQYSTASYAPLIKRELGLADDTLILCGISIGYQSERPKTLSGPPRLDFEELVRFI